MFHCPYFTEMPHFGISTWQNSQFFDPNQPIPRPKTGSRFRQNISMFWSKQANVLCNALCRINEIGRVNGLFRHASENQKVSKFDDLLTF